MAHANAALTPRHRLKLARAIVGDGWTVAYAAERFHRTSADGWAFARMFGSESARRKALPAWLHEYNPHRPPPRSATGRPSPA